MNSRRFCEREAEAMLKKVISPVLFLFLLNLFPVTASAGVPDWLHNLANAPQKKYADDVNAVVLLDDQETTVRDNGEIITHERMAFRILRPEGRRHAQYEVSFDGETKLNYLRGWSITAKGQEDEGKDKDTFERSTSTYEVFTDQKQRIILLPGGDVGSVVGYEYEQKRRPYTFQDDWHFQYGLPVERTRYEL